MKSVICKRIAFDRIYLVPTFKVDNLELYTFHLQPEFPLTTRSIIRAMHNDFKFKNSPFYSKDGCYCLYPSNKGESKNYKWGRLEIAENCTFNIVHENRFIYKK